MTKALFALVAVTKAFVVVSKALVATNGALVIASKAWLAVTKAFKAVTKPLVAAKECLAVVGIVLETSSRTHVAINGGFFLPTKWFAGVNRSRFVLSSMGMSFSIQNSHRISLEPTNGSSRQRAVTKVTEKV